MDVDGAIRKFFNVIGTPYAEMEPWKRSKFLQMFFAIEVLLDMLVYLPFVLLQHLATRDEWNFQQLLVAAWCVCEIVFHAYCQLRVNQLKRKKKEIPIIEPRKRLELATTMCEHMMDPEAELGGWLVGQQSEKLCIGDVSKWLIWAFFAKEPDMLTTGEWDEAEVILKMFKQKLGSERRWGSSWKGENKCLRPTLDAMEYKFRPLVMVVGLSFYKMALLWSWHMDGYEWHPGFPGFSYWVREPVGEAEGETILFLHGAGLGIYLYPVLLRSLARQHPNRRILVPYVAAASNSVIEPHLLPQEIMYGMDLLLKETNTKKVSILAHSYGSIHAGWLAKHNPDCIAKVTLIDPIAFQTWDSVVTFISTYSVPINIVHHIFGIISRDPFARAYLHSYWISNYIITPEVFTAPTEIYIAERDWIVDSSRSYKYLMDRKAKSNLDNLNVHLVDMSHGEYQLSPKYIARFNADL
ncbi:hypothetical protein DSO57_1026749 [Entomophthora muscae]|uniref:Uncharacterized protein n=1 Tax=Entomophthora muscae TaxID=34485 RepID=A0ACC2S3Z5_9FUNG|nr:hypothetical protein DSO57_1026749 [Entomophthora muscae]